LVKLVVVKGGLWVVTDYDKSKMELMPLEFLEGKTIEFKDFNKVVWFDKTKGKVGVFYEFTETNE
jgi:hypothetical protein